MTASFDRGRPSVLVESRCGSESAYWYDPVLYRMYSSPAIR